MAIHNRYSSSPDADNMEKYGQDQSAEPVDSHSAGHVSENGPGQSLHRGLKARHITMIAIGGAIGSIYNFLVD